MNRLTIIGNLTSNPESRVVDTANGPQTVCNFTVAVNRVTRGNKTTDYFRVSCWNRTAENAMQYLTKGSKVAVVGPVTARAYKDRDGEARASMEIPAENIEYLSSRSENTQAQPQQERPQPAPQVSDDGFMNIPDGLDEELPFN